MVEVEPEMLKRGGVIFVDGREEVLREAGEFQAYEGQMCELGTVCAEAQGGKALETWDKAGGDLTIFKSGEYTSSCACVINLC